MQNRKTRNGQKHDKEITSQKLNQVKKNHFF